MGRLNGVGAVFARCAQARRAASPLWLYTLVLLIGLSSTAPQPAAAYGVLTHHQLIDQSWTSIIVPLLLHRYPPLTNRQLQKAHAYAYGGCVIQDLGYYPFANGFIADLMHYVRAGDFVQSLFHNAHNADELAFAIGALSHFVGDSIGHSQATNPSVALLFPKLRAKYGSSVNYAQDKHAHSRVELAFEANQFASARLAPSGYLHEIGLAVPQAQLATAFYETYGFPLGNVAGLYHTAMRSYRIGARTFLPTVVYAEAMLHHRRFPADTQGPELQKYLAHTAELAHEEGWEHYPKKPGTGSYVMATFIAVLPKIGPLSMLKIKGPTVETKELYIESVNRATDALALALHELTSGRPKILVANRDLDTGARVAAGGYRLMDETYDKLLGRITANPAQPIPAGVKQDLIEYYADPDAPITTRRNPKMWARVQQQLQTLADMPVDKNSADNDRWISIEPAKEGP